MDASNRASQQPAPRYARRRADCSPAGSRPPRSRGSTNCGRQAAEPLTVIFRVVPLEGPDAEKIRARQLAVIVRLLRRAIEAQTTETDARTPGARSDYQPAAGDK
jgi:hypothetical protein